MTLLGLKSDYSLLNSMNKISDVVLYATQNKIENLGICDDNLFGAMEFYDTCIKNKIKPIIGLEVKAFNTEIYLYAKNFDGYQNLLKINTIIGERTIDIVELEKYQKNVICLVNLDDVEVFKRLSKIYQDIYIVYQNDYEKNNALILTNKIIFQHVFRTIQKEDIKYLKYLYKINDQELEDESEYLKITNDQEDIKFLDDFAKKIDLVIDKSKRYIPTFDVTKNSSDYLRSLCNLGLKKRLNNQVNIQYQKRLEYELSVIEKMGFVDYFLIVFDYVRYAKNNDIMVGPGRGSAAGSLVSYCLGITNVDPLKYDLLFERFLNPERVTMPDIDVDFEDVKRDEMVNYVRERYGKDKVAPIMTFGTLGSRQVLKDLCRVLNGETVLVDRLCKMIDPKVSLQENLNNEMIKKMVNSNKFLTNIYQAGMKIEGLKRHISTHAAGVVISSIPLDDIIPVALSNETINTGVTMNYLEELGLLKMDFLALSNLTTIHNILLMLDNKVELKNIDLEDSKVYEMFSKADTEGIFQYESSGMKNVLKKLKPKCFSDIVSCVAMFRPGPMENIDSFIARKEGKEPIAYLDNSLEPILKDTYGIIVYQEQIMQILVKMGKYSFAEADNIRRAMSKKKMEVIKKEEEHFITAAVENGYRKDVAEQVYTLILKFANYGFNKAHSVCYALIGYQMAYLKTYYPVYFIANLINMSIGSEIKVKEYIDEAKQRNILILKPDINLSINDCKVGTNKIRLPMAIIKNVGVNAQKEILEEREKGEYKDFFDFVGRVYGKSVTKKTIECLIDADALSSFNYNHQTLANNIENALRYAELANSLDLDLIEKPVMEEMIEYDANTLMQRELNCYGFYLSNHPASKYQAKDIMKLNQVRDNFDKFVKCVVIINNIRQIKTKKNQDMAFITASDEFDKMDFIIFPSNYQMVYNIKKNDLVLVTGRVARRLDKFQINVESIKKLEVE